ncbi:MAG: hypothetical protein IJN22_06625 [Clostridia bacterium]|nr:hypothetical protein [Clostridia bacterium]
MDCKSIVTKNSFNLNNNIYKKHVKLENGAIYININDTEFNNSMISKIIKCINHAHKKYSFSRLPIYFVFQEAKLEDKLSYTIFECICKSLIENYGHKLNFCYNFEHNIITKGILSSPLLLLSCNDKKTNQKNQKFLEKFNFDIYRNHYRKVLKYDEYNSEKLSEIYDDVFNFQKSFNINYECIDKIAEVVVELICNAIEHSCSDCLLDIDLAPNYINNKTGERCCGINITVLNISDKLLGDGIKEKINNYNYMEDKSKQRYPKVKEAYDFHKKCFSEEYDEVDFYNISAFQHKISGRKDNYSTGGTGLTLLIKSIEERADSHTCYVITGDRIIALLPEYLTYDENNWLGFNDFNDYFKHIPSQEIINRSNFFFPGTAYNLNFVMKVNNDEQN